MKNIHSVMRWFLLTACLLLLSNSAFAQARTISGTVIDDKGETVPFAAVFVTGTTSGVQTDMQGKFSLTVPADARSITVRFIGYKEKIIQLNSGTNNYDIRIESEITALSEFVVVGNMERNKESFTGTFSTVTGNELKQVGSGNLVESLKSLDPSFAVLDNTISGADPNAMPTIEVRGQTALNIASELEDMYATDPNQPLFVLDGFETSLQKIIDLDPNRIATVDILKDAASTAFYGSRAANGVVVVTTIKGEPGRFKVFYTGDYTVQTPNLSSYNMMNAEEKLLFEKLSGRYTYGGNENYGVFEKQVGLDSLYNARLAEVKRGVNSYWMGDPLQTPLTHRQSFRLTGGTNELMINAGLSYRSAPGVMKESSRQAWSGDLDLNYTGDKIAFVNQLSLSGYTAEHSPYGSFSTWVQTNPYFRKTNEDGGYSKLLDDVVSNTNTSMQGTYRVFNPLYIAGLPQLNEARSTSIDERFNVRWNFYKGMKLEGLLQVAYNHGNTITFKPSEHPDYDNVDDAQKGSYSNSTNKMMSYTTNLMYVWNNTIGDHTWVLNLRGELGSNNSMITTWSASGFPLGVNPNPRNANNYVEGGRPSYSNPITRRVNLLASVNYVYKNRYLFDGTFREDGSTVFGSAKKFTPFWSTGIGWNMHEEDFMKGSRHFISLLRIKGSIGETGNQNIGSSNSTSIYQYLLGGNVFGPGVTIMTLGNPNVEWQKTTQTNLTLELDLFDNRFTSDFSVFDKITTPLVVSVSQAPSSGVVAFPMSLGTIRYKGFEYDFSYSFIRTNNLHWRVRFMGRTQMGEYDGFTNKLEAMDKNAQNNNQLNRYRDGYSPKTIWAVRSLGINPITGREMFLTEDGKMTYVFDPSDAVAVGMGEPKLTGTMNSYVTWKQLTFILVLRYSWKEERFNSALFNKVENISMNQVGYNQDRRALYDRWQNPGDIAQFKSINLVGVDAQPQMSSRFIQTESYISGESVGLTYRFKKDGWIKKLGMERLDLTATAVGTSGVFRLSNIQYERGTAYPEAYTFSLSISAAF